MADKIAEWAKELQSLAQAGLFYGRDVYDRERYQRVRDLIVVGAYQAGSDPQMERAVQLYPHLEKFLQQKITESADYENSLAQLFALFQMAPPAPQGAAPQPVAAPQA